MINGAVYRRGGLACLVVCVVENEVQLLTLSITGLEPVNQPFCSSNGWNSTKFASLTKLPASLSLGGRVNPRIKSGDGHGELGD